MRTISALIAAFVIGASATAIAADPPTAAAHVEKARGFAGKDFEGSLFLCDPEGGMKILNAALAGFEHWLPPTRMFDDLSYIGTDFVGVFVLRTSAGLILFDSTGSMADARDHLVPALKVLGLDPATIKYVIVTHAHWDHYGGAKYLQDTYGAKIALSAEDWNLLDELPVGGIERAPTFGPDKGDRTPPRRDVVVRNGDKITLGDKTVTLFVSPGHTPGTLSALIPVSEGGKPYVLSLLGGTAFPRTLEPANHMGGLRAFSASVEALSKASQAVGAVGLINTHIFVDGTSARLATAQARQPGQPNPFILGKDAVTRYYGMFDECLKAAEERPPAPPMDMTKLQGPKN